MRRQRIRAALTALLATCALTPACGDGGGGEASLPEADENPPLVLGRAFDVTVYEGSERSARLPITIGSDDPHLRTVLGNLEQICHREAHLAERFDTGYTPPEGRRIIGEHCGVDGAREQQMLLCMGHQLMGMGESVMPLDFVREGESAVQRRARRILEEDGRRPTPELTIPVQDAEGRATLTLWATVAFQKAALLGAHLMDPETCVDGSLGGTVPPYEGTEEPTPLAFVVASATTEAMQQLMDAGMRSRDEIAAAAAEVRSADRDGARATRNFFRAESSSTLAAANVLTAVPASMFTKNPSLFGGDADEGDFPVCDPPPSRESTQHALGLLRETGVLIDADAVSTGIVTDRLRSALEEDDPGTFASAELSGLSTGAFFSQLGVSTHDVRQAASYLRNEREVFGRPNVPYTAPGGSVPRVRGTSEPSAPPPDAYLFARLTGSVRTFHELGRSHRPSTGYGRFGLQETSEEYGTGSVFETLDVVAATLERATHRADLSRTASGREFDEAKVAITTARVFAREQVPMRAQTCVGRPMDGEAVDRMRIRLYGADADRPTRYELWAGEAGLECATTGAIDGVACDEAAYRVRLEPAARDGAERSGFGPRYLELDVNGESLPREFEGRLPETTRLYVTEAGTSAGALREPVLGVTALAGPSDGEFSRCVTSPAGASVLAELGRIAGASPEDCTEPVEWCDGLPSRLPLENELVRALDGTGEDGIETSFVHYLRLARTAADEADALGQELIQYGFEMDLRAEAAAEELEELCGDAVNVTSLPGISPTTPCSTDAQCPEGNGEGAGWYCDGGICQPESVLTYLTDSADGESLRQCLGLGGEPQTAATLGSVEKCAWRLGNGALGSTAGLGDPADPTSIAHALGCLGIDEQGRATGCPDGFYDPVHGSCSGPGTPLEDVTDPAFRGVVVEPLYIVSGELSTRSAQSCEDFGRIMARGWMGESGGSLFPSTPNEHLLEQVLSAEWMSHAVMKGAAEGLLPAHGPLAFDRVLMHNRTWMRLGALSSGSSAQWPCQPRMTGPECSGEFGMVPLGCGRDCNTYDARLFTGDELRWRSAALQRLGGVRARWVSSIFGTHVGFSDAALSPLAAEIVNDHTICPRINDSFPPCLDTAQLLTGVDNAGRQFQCIQRGSHANAYPDDILSHSICEAGGYLIDGDIVGGGNAFFTYDGLDLLYRPDGVIRHAVARYYRGEVEWDTPLFGTIPSSPGASSFDTNIAVSMLSNDHAPNRVITYGDLMAGLEMGCWAHADGGGSGSCLDFDAKVDVRTVGDMDRLGSQLRCTANRFERQAAQMVFADLPHDIIDDLRLGTIDATYPSYRGEQGRIVGELRAELTAIPATANHVAGIVRDFATVIENAKSQVDVEHHQQELIAIETLSEQLDQMTNCAVATAQSASILEWGNGVAAAATCANSIAQSVLAAQSSIAQTAISNEQIQQALLQVGLDFGTRVDELVAQEQQLQASFARVNALLAQLDQIRSRARRAAAKVLFLESDETGKEYHVNNVMRARMSTAVRRYRRALRNAIRLSWIATRAVEQRLGVDLSDMTEEMALVAPPAQWADRICSMGGIDYAKIRGELEGPIDDYADEFVGDYVRQLELFVESYQFDHPFQDGADTTVVSLRDDLLRARRVCDVESYNLLAWSFQPGQQGWSVECGAGQRCAAVEPVEGDSPFLARFDEGGDPVERTLGQDGAHRLRSTCPEASWDEGLMSCSATNPGGVVAQAVALEPGTHLLSWYEALDAPLHDCDAACAGCGDDEVCFADCARTCVRDHCAGATSEEPAIEVELAGEPGAQAPVLDGAPAFLEAGEPGVDECRWRRAMVRVQVPEAQLVSIGFRLAVAPGDVEAKELEGRFSAPQLEALEEAEAALASLPPRTYFATDGDRVGPHELCPDDGTEFRSPRYWARRCEYVCPEGLGVACGGDEVADRATLRCFYETSFRLTQDMLDRGEMLRAAGFADGNFNYRHRGLAVNLVGVGVRRCDPDDGEACFATGTVPYSLRHDGPFTVRNHAGEDYQAPLFDARIEHGRALAAERFITNPLASADRALLAGATEDALLGRPLAGSYTLRIYDTPGLRWSSLDDVQLVLDYGYWTRFE